MGAAERQADAHAPPTQSNTPGTGITRLAATTTAANAAIPKTMQGKLLRVQPQGDRIWVGFGPTGSVNVDKSQTGGTTIAAGTIDDNGCAIPEGDHIDVILQAGLHDQISWQANAANSTLLIVPISGPDTKTRVR